MAFAPVQDSACVMLDSLKIVPRKEVKSAYREHRLTARKNDFIINFVN